MNSIPQILMPQSGTTILILFEPEALVFRNTITTTRFWRRKKREVYLNWERNLAEESFFPRFRDEAGVQYMNQQAAETHLEAKIKVLEIIRCTRPIIYDGHCDKCGTYHLEDNGLLATLVGEESQVRARTIALPKESEITRKCGKCNNPTCSGSVTKTLRIR